MHDESDRKSEYLATAVALALPRREPVCLIDITPRVAHSTNFSQFKTESLTVDSDDEVGRSLYLYRGVIPLIGDCAAGDSWEAVEHLAEYHFLDHSLPD